MTDLTDKDFNTLKQLLEDAAKRPDRLSEWESNFLVGIRSGFAMLGRRISLSVKQWEIIERIEQKVYRT